MAKISFTQDLLKTKKIEKTYDLFRCSSSVHRKVVFLKILQLLFSVINSCKTHTVCLRLRRISNKPCLIRYREKNQKQTGS